MQVIDSKDFSSNGPFRRPGEEAFFTSPSEGCFSIKMRMFIILINFVFALAVGVVGCSNSNENQGGDNIQADIAGRPAETQPSDTNDPLKKLQDEGKLPPDAEGKKLPVLPQGSDVFKNSGPEILSLPIKN